jgi:hypothetical protein
MIKKFLTNYILANILINGFLIGIQYINNNHKMPMGVVTDALTIAVVLIPAFVIVWFWRGLLRWATKKTRDKKVKIKIKKQKKD